MNLPFFFLILLLAIVNWCKSLRAEAQPLTIKQGMVLIKGQTYYRGNEKSLGNPDHYLEERPVHLVEVSSFWIDQYEVTNAQFKEFVDATGYVTFAEKPVDQTLFPNASGEHLLPGATVFSPPPKSLNPYSTNDPWQWWAYRPGANWRHPQGPDSSIEKIMDHPVVCVNINDARAYAKWAKKRLPTEAEWELAARGGLKQAMFTWGNEHKPEGEWYANCFQGNFPARNSVLDGFLFTAPVGSFPKNGYGLYDMAGNVWEICSDYYHPQYYQIFVSHPHKNPKGPEYPISQIELNYFQQTGTCPMPKEIAHDLLSLHVARGGSFLCHSNYCLRYRPASRSVAESLAPTNHTGFRCVRDTEEVF